MINKNQLIDSFINEFNNTKKRVLNLKAKYSPGEFKIHPAKNKWSAGDCLEHIATTNKGYIENSLAKLDKTEKSDTENKNYKPRYLMQKFINLMKPKSKMKFKAPGVLVKLFNGNLDKTIENFLDVQNEFIQLAEKTREYDLKTKISSPVTSLLKFQLGEMFMAMIEHQKRHLEQAEKALESVHSVNH